MSFFGLSWKITSRCRNWKQCHFFRFSGEMSVTWHTRTGSSSWRGFCWMNISAYLRCFMVKYDELVSELISRRHVILFFLDGHLWCDHSCVVPTNLTRIFVVLEFWSRFYRSLTLELQRVFDGLNSVPWFNISIDRMFKSVLMFIYSLASLKPNELEFRVLVRLDPMM